MARIPLYMSINTAAVDSVYFLLYGWDWIRCSVFHSEIRLHLWLCLGWLLFKNNNFVPFTSLFSEFDTYRRIWVLISFYLLYLYNLTLQTMLMYIDVVNVLHPLTHFPFMVFLALKPPSYSEISKALSFISLMLWWSGQLNTSNGLYSYLFLKSIPWSCVRWLWGLRMLWRSTFQTYLGSGGSYKYVPTFKSLCYLEDALPMINIYIFCFYSQGSDPTWA